MVDYYEVLSNKHTQLSRDNTVAEIRSKLIELESLWTDRAATQPEKATEMLALINQAKKVFADESAKAAYDRELFAPPKVEKREDPDAARRAEFQKWQNKAAEYAQTHQNDLAKTAIEQAMKFQVGDDSAFLSLAAGIYFDNGEYQTALGYINRAILLTSNDANMYITKAWTLERLYLAEQRYDRNRAATYLRQARDTAEAAIQMAVRQKNAAIQSRAEGCKAFLLYFHEPKNAEEAEFLADSALSYNRNDPNARRVMEAVDKERAIREAAQKRREAEEREEQEREKAAQIASEKRREIEAQKKKVEKEESVYLALMFIIPVLLLASIPCIYPRKDLQSGGLLVFTILSVTMLFYNYCVNAGDWMAVGWRIFGVFITLGVAAVLFRWYLCFPWCEISVSKFSGCVIVFFVAGVIGMVLGIIHHRKNLKKCS